MQMPIVATKLSIPPIRSGNVPRPRLLDILDAGLEGQVILLSAPAGFGKTTLLAEWLRGLPRQAAWLALDEGDNDAVRFWSYFVVALQQLWPEAGRDVPAMLTAARPVPIQAVLTVLANEIAAAGSPAVLVLDDLHLVTAGVIQDGLGFFVAHLPETITLVIGTRADPAGLPLARMRARRQLTEIRLEDLRFTEAEAAQFLTRSLKLPLSEADVAALEARTEGWIAGLQMAALSLRGAPDPAAFIRDFTGSHRHVLDYLLEEVLAREPAEVRDFLLQTAPLARLCAGLCEAVTGRTDGQAMLERLESSNLFVIALDHERRWFRYHALFAELLAAQLGRSQPGLAPELHRRAAGWLEQNGDCVEANRHVLAAGDFEQSAHLLEKSFFDLLARSEIGTLVSWVRSLPDGTVRTHPWLCVLDAWLLILTGQAGAIEARLQEAGSALPSAGLPAAEAERIRGYAAAIRAQVLFIQGQAPAAIGHAAEALARLTPADFVIGGTTAMILGAAHAYTGDFPAAVAAFERSKATSLAGGNQFNAMIGSAALAQIAAARGRLRDAHQIYTDGLHQTETSASLAPGYAYVGLADILREWDRLDEALEYATRGVEMCELLGQADILMTGYAVLARIRRGRGERETAGATLEKARRVASEISAWSLDAVLIQQARLWLSAGDVASAARWAQESGYAVDEPPLFHREAGLLTLARVLTAQGKYEQADALLDRLQSAAAAADRHTGEIEACLLRAINFAAQRPEDVRAKGLLERALWLSEPEGFTRLYLDEGEAALALIRRFAPESALAGRMARPCPAAQPVLIDPLSERELDVLRLLAAGRSNPEIAGTLFVSLNTVKAHVKSIFGKLGVHNRSQALLKAQELKLI